MPTLLPSPAEGVRPDPGPLTLAKQGSFFVGGRDVHSDTLSTVPAYAAEGTVTADQVYMRHCQADRRRGGEAGLRPPPWALFGRQQSTLRDGARRRAAPGATGP